MARHQDRDFAILLPQWVRLEDLIINALILLPHCRLRCLPWEPYRNARLSELTYKAGIKLNNLLFECWSTSKVSAIVSGFGRFLRADPNSINMVDLIGFCCLIAVDDLADIPDNLALTMGDIIVSVSVRIERTAPFGGDDRGTPFAGGDPGEGEDQTDPLGRPIARRVPTAGASLREVDSRDGLRPGNTDSWNSSEMRDRWRALTPGSGRSTRPTTINGAAPVSHLAATMEGFLGPRRITDFEARLGDLGPRRVDRSSPSPPFLPICGAHRSKSAQIGSISGGVSLPRVVRILVGAGPTSEASRSMQLEVTSIREELQLSHSPRSSGTVPGLVPRPSGLGPEATTWYGNLDLVVYSFGAVSSCAAQDLLGSYTSSRAPLWASCGRFPGSVIWVALYTPAGPLQVLLFGPFAAEVPKPIWVDWACASPSRTALKLKVAHSPHPGRGPSDPHSRPNSSGPASKYGPTFCLGYGESGPQVTASRVGAEENGRSVMLLAGGEPGTEAALLAGVNPDWGCGGDLIFERDDTLDALFTLLQHSGAPAHGTTPLTTAGLSSRAGGAYLTTRATVVREGGCQLGAGGFGSAALAGGAPPACLALGSGSDGEAFVASGGPPTRRSPRLANRSGVHLLMKAIERKAALRDGGTKAVDSCTPCGPSVLLGPSCAEARALRKIIRKSNKCGIAMSNDDARSFLEFLRSSA